MFYSIVKAKCEPYGNEYFWTADWRHAMDLKITLKECGWTGIKERKIICPDQALEGQICRAVVGSSLERHLLRKYFDKQVRNFTET